jgi:hypothetical protein
MFPKVSKQNSMELVLVFRGSMDIEYFFFRKCGCQLNFKTIALFRKQEKNTKGN